MERYAGLIEAGEPEAADWQLLHYESYYDRSAPLRSVIGPLGCIDIAAFPGKTVTQMLQQLNPHVVVGLTIENVFDRIMYLTCAKLGLPTVFLQHGSWVDSDNELRFLKGLDDGFTVADRIKGIPKFLRFLPWYLDARQGSRVDSALVRFFWRLLCSPTVSHFFPMAPEELWPTIALVYNQAAIDTLLQTHLIPKDRLHVVGNPELDSVVRRRREPLSSSRRAELINSQRLQAGVPILCHIEDGFVEQQNCFGWTERRRVALVKELYTACRRVGAQLLVRPHPATDIRAMQRELCGVPGAVVTRGMTLLDQVDISDAAVGTLSTAVETAVVLEKPLLVPLWHINGEAVLSPYLRYRVATPVNSAADLSSTIQRALCQELPRPDISEFSSRRLGPLDGNALRRIFSAILKLGRAGATGRNLTD